MKKLTLSLIACAFVALVASPAAHAQPEATPVTSSNSAGGGAGLGFGAATFLGGISGVEVAYDQSIWHIEGLLGFNRSGNGNNPDSTETRVGVRGWYHLKQGLNADFSVGGGIGFSHASVGDNSSNSTLFEPAFQARAFLTPNVAVFGIAGLAIRFADNNNSVGFGGQTLAGFGFTYYLR